MFLLNWYKVFLIIRRENDEMKLNLKREQVCENCEYLKNQIEIERQFNKVLFDKLTARPELEVPVQSSVPPIPMPKHIPWRVRQQQLEAESRRAAEIMRSKQNEIKESGVQIAPDNDPDVIALEKEMGIVEKERLSKDAISSN